MIAAPSNMDLQSGLLKTVAQHAFGALSLVVHLAIRTEAVDRFARCSQCLSKHL